MPPVDVGQLGEKVLEVWSAELGVSCNPAYQDRRGWDYLLEFPRSDTLSRHSLDSRPPELSCLVQVKSTFSNRTSRSIKLSNWERAIKRPFPFFYLCLHFDKSNNKLREAYLVHVGQEWMEKVLRRLRTEQIKGHSDLSSMKMNLTWSEDDQIRKPESASFSSTLRTHIPGTVQEYVQNKISLFQNLGEPIPAELNFTISYSDPNKIHEDWIDLAIGLRDTIEIAQLEIREDIRFDLPLATTKHEGGFLQVINRSKEGTEISLAIKNNSLPLKSSFAAKLFTPHNFFAGTPIPEKKFKARVTFLVGEIVIRTYDKELSLRVDFSSAPDVAPLSQHAEIWRLAHILHNAAASGVTVCITPPGQADIDFVLPQTSVGRVDPNYLAISQAVDHARYVADRTDVPISTSVPLTQLVSQAVLFRHLRAIMDPEIPIAMIGGVITEKSYEESSTLAAALVKRVQFASTSILIQIGLMGVARYSTDSDGSNIFMIDQPKTILLRHHLENIRTSDSEELLSSCVQELETRGINVIRLLDPIDKGLGVD
jgi:hypothetical protein